MNSIESYTVDANSVKEMVLYRLHKDGIITEEQANEYSEKWYIIIIKPSWFKQWLKKFGSNNEELTFKFVRFED